MSDRGTELFYQQQALQAARAKAQAYARAGIPTPPALSNNTPAQPVDDSATMDSLLNAMTGGSGGGASTGGGNAPSSAIVEEALPPAKAKSKQASPKQKIEANTNTGQQTTHPKGAPEKMMKGQSTSQSPVPGVTGNYGDPNAGSDSLMVPQSAMPVASAPSVGAPDPNDFMAALHSAVSQPSSTASGMPNELMALLGAGAAGGAALGAGAIADQHMQTSRGNKAPAKGPQAMTEGDLGAVKPSNDAWFNGAVDAATGDAPQKMTEGDINVKGMSPQDVEMTGMGQQIDNLANKTMGKNAVSKPVRDVLKSVRTGATDAASAMQALRDLGESPGVQEALSLLAKLVRGK